MSISTRALAKTIAELTALGKGILAADESAGTIAKRFQAMNVASTEEARRDYRELLFSTPGLGDFISGVILFEETLKQKSAAGVPLPEVLNAQGIVPGIKVDKGTVLLPEFPSETLTQGLDGLAQRLSEYKQLGARFAKWRAVIHIDAGIPTPQAIASNAHALARYAAICQEQGVVPIVEPEVLMDGDHTLATSARVTEEVLHAVFHALHQQRVALEYMILKPNMVEPSRAWPRLPGACHAATGGASNAYLPAAHGASSDARDQLSLRWSKRSNSHRQPACLERHGTETAVGLELFVRARVAGIRAPDLARRDREQVDCAANAI